MLAVATLQRPSVGCHALAGNPSIGLAQAGWCRRQLGLYSSRARISTRTHTQGPGGYRFKATSPEVAVSLPSAQLGGGATTTAGAAIVSSNFLPALFAWPSERPELTLRR